MRVLEAEKVIALLERCKPLLPKRTGQGPTYPRKVMTRENIDYIIPRLRTAAFETDSAHCAFPDGIVIKPDGVNELDPCIYETVERHANVTVEVRRCSRCGKMDVVWFRQEDTIDEEV